MRYDELNLVQMLNVSNVLNIQRQADSVFVRPLTAFALVGQVVVLQLFQV